MLCNATNFERWVDGQIQEKWEHVLHFPDTVTDSIAKPLRRTAVKLRGSLKDFEHVKCSVELFQSERDEAVPLSWQLPSRVQEEWTNPLLRCYLS